MTCTPVVYRSPLQHRETSAPAQTRPRRNSIDKKRRKRVSVRLRRMRSLTHNFRQCSMEQVSRSEAHHKQAPRSYLMPEGKRDDDGNKRGGGDGGGGEGSGNGGDSPLHQTGRGRGREVPPKGEAGALRDGTTGRAFPWAVWYRSPRSLTVKRTTSSRGPECPGRTAGHSLVAAGALEERTLRLPRVCRTSPGEASRLVNVWDRPPA